MAISTAAGRPLPFGVTRGVNGHNFALFSKNARRVILLLYTDPGREGLAELTLSPDRNRTGDVWHVLVTDLPTRFLYAYQLDGPWQPENGHCFDPTKRLLDPYVKAISGLERWGDRRRDRRSLLGCYLDIDYDWEDDRPPNIPLTDTVIYELHVRGFNRHPSARSGFPGTFKGIAENVGYFKELGITAVELMPIHEFDETDCPYRNPLTGEPLLNFWGYSSIGFFALKTAYAAVADGAGAIVEFRNMVKTLHKAGIEVLIDVVFNHTAEGDRERPVYNFKGIENSVYYILDEQGDYRNYSGCGNTLNCNHPVVRQMIMDALRYWVVEMHVDGFRFDLASVLTRDEKGNVLPEPPLLEAIAKDPVLSKTKIIAEAWDAAGLYQVGSFPASKRWAEWNGRYRDTVRRFAAGEPGLAGEMATRLAGSEDLYRHSERNPYHSINFVTSHDGFTMMDLVSYQRKHNEMNGEQNRDGCDHNFSRHFGVEGPTHRPEIIQLRERQIRNLATILLLSQGTPMMLSGDEFGQSKQGNNNSWCQDNEISWLDWGLLEQNRALLLFWRQLIQLRKQHAALRRKTFFTGAISPVTGIADISWHNAKAGQPEFDQPHRSLAFMIDGVALSPTGGEILYGAMNFNEQPMQFELPIVHSIHPWEQILSTAQPTDFIAGNTQVLAGTETVLTVEGMSIVLLSRLFQPEPTSGDGVTD
jgi:isoamylase